MRNILLLILTNMLWTSMTYGAVTYETETVEPAYTFAVIYPNVNQLGFFVSKEAAFSKIKATWDVNTNGYSAVASNLHDGTPNSTYPIVNGKASWYFSDSTNCSFYNNENHCSQQSGPTIGMWANNCPKDVKIVDGLEYRFNPGNKVLGPNNVKVFCSRTFPVKKTVNDCGAGNPILPASGEKIQPETDYRSEDGVLEFTRTYRSNSGQSFSVATSFLMDNSSTQFKRGYCYYGLLELSSLPTATTVPYCYQYFPSGEMNYTVHLASGRTLRFTGLSSDTSTGLSTHDRLEKQNNAQGESEWILTREDNTKEIFNDNGNQIRTILPSGKIKTYVYSDATTSIDRASKPGLLLAMSDDKGHSLQFSYNASSQLIKMTDPKGNNFLYAYDGFNNIASVTYPSGASRQYRYAEVNNINNGVPCNRPASAYSRLLTGIIDENGVRFADFKYNCDTKAISTEHVGGVEKFSLTYNSDGSTTVTNPLNKKTIYRYSDINNARRVTSVEGQPTTNCAGANQNYTYTPEGWVASKTDWNGNKTTYQYNTKGQETSRTEAFGSAVAKTISTQWHATFNLKTKVTEPDKETVYTYDTNGLLLNQNTRSLP